MDIGKLKTTPVNLSKLSDVVKNSVVKKTEYDELVKKKLITNLATTAAFNAKINEVKGEISSITGLSITTALTAIENKIPNVNTHIQKADYDTKISEIEKKLNDDHGNKYITTQEFNRLTAENFAARLKQANLATKAEIADFDRF